MYIKSIAIANDYLHKALNAASGFIHNEGQLITDYQLAQAHYVKYIDVFDLRFSFKIFLLVAPAFHFIFAVQEGFVVQPIASELAIGVIPEEWLHTSGWLIAVCLFGCSLAFGHFLHTLQIEKNRLELRKHRIANKSNLLFAIILGGFYIFLLFKFSMIAKQKSPYDHSYTDFILIFGLIELILGYASVKGYEVIFAHLKRSWLQKRYRNRQKKLLIFSRSCSQNYRFFCQSKDLLTSDQQRALLGIASFGKIQIAIDYYERHLGKIGDTRLIDLKRNKGA